MVHEETLEEMEHAKIEAGGSSGRFGSLVVGSIIQDDLSVVAEKVTGGASLGADPPPPMEWLQPPPPPIPDDVTPQAVGGSDSGAPSRAPSCANSIVAEVTGLEAAASFLDGSRRRGLSYVALAGQDSEAAEAPTDGGWRPSSSGGGAPPTVPLSRLILMLISSTRPASRAPSISVTVVTERSSSPWATAAAAAAAAVGSDSTSLPKNSAGSSSLLARTGLKSRTGAIRRILCTPISAPALPHAPHAIIPLRTARPPQTPPRRAPRP